MSFRIYKIEDNEAKLIKNFYLEKDSINYFNKMIEELYKNSSLRGESLIKDIYDRFLVKSSDSKRNLTLEYVSYLALDFFDFSKYENSRQVQEINNYLKKGILNVF